MSLAPIQLDQSLNRAMRARAQTGARGGPAPAGPMFGPGRAGPPGAAFAAHLRSAASDRTHRNLPTPAALLDPSRRSSSLRPLSPLEMIPGIKGPARALGPLFPPAAALAPMTEEDLVPGARSSKSTEQRNVEATARKWLAQTFYGTLLKQMRSSPFKSELFNGGRGGEAFSTLLDQHLADHMARSTDHKLAAAIARKVMGNRNVKHEDMNHQEMEGGRAGSASQDTD